jgi:hypothetical protein
MNVRVGMTLCTPLDFLTGPHDLTSIDNAHTSFKLSQTPKITIMTIRKKWQNSKAIPEDDAL